MNLKAFVQTLSTKEREELFNILTEDTSNWTTRPPHIEEVVPRENIASEDFVMHKPSVLSSNKRREAVRAESNTWTDEGEDRHIETPSIKRTPRTRKAPAKKNVTCHVCGKSQEINASLVYGEFYRCDRCTGR